LLKKNGCNEIIGRIAGAFLFGSSEKLKKSLGELYFSYIGNADLCLITSKKYLDIYFLINFLEKVENKRRA
jgi:hypothetical protein